MKKQHLVYDIEIIGDADPVFLVCCMCLETGVGHSFWYHKKGDLTRFYTLLEDKKYTWISFNGNKFDAPLLAAWINGRDVHTLKLLANRIIEQRMQPWESYQLAGCTGLAFDHIDLIEVAPGVLTSLKTYAGRMSYKTMVDMPFHHTQDLTAKECKVLEHYCMNDLGVTAALFYQLSEEIALRRQLGSVYNLDLRSKSGPQVAEAILKKAVGFGKGNTNRPLSINYTMPSILKLTNPELITLAEALEDTDFAIDQNGAPLEPEWMNEPFALRGGHYKVGIGGLHSQHDLRLHRTATEDIMISDFDVASYYPNIMMKCELIPKMSGKGEEFMAQYARLYEQRIAAKRAGDKAVANSLKLALNGTYGKLGSIYSSFYSPDLMLAVCLTGQLNLLNLIDQLAKQKGVAVLSANTDGITVQYAAVKRASVLKTIALNAKQTGFEYEETQYSTIAMKDVNNYLVIKPDGGVKAKGIYAPVSLEKNPTAPICALAAAEYLKKGTKPATFIRRQKKPELFMTIRGISAGGIQHKRMDLVDDWELVNDVGTKDNEWHSPRVNRTVHRKSRPHPVEVGTGGTPFGRVARWYMTTKEQPAITNCKTGARIPKTEGSQLCMTLPAALPADLDFKWYVDETYRILDDLGVAVHPVI